METPAPGRTVAFGHIGVHVSDLQRSIDYYRDVIGLEQVERRIRDDAYLSTVTGYAEVRLDTCLLVDRSSGIMLELLEMLSSPGEAMEPGTANPGTMHMCFIVDDVDAVHARAVAAGHSAVNDPVTPTAGGWQGGRSVYLLDPDRVRVEIVQPGPDA